MDAPPQLENVAPWLRMHALLGAHGVRVPQVLAQDLENGFLLLEDMGVPTLAQVLTDANADDLLDGAIGQLLLLQKSRHLPIAACSAKRYCSAMLVCSKNGF